MKRWSSVFAKISNEDIREKRRPACPEPSEGARTMESGMSGMEMRTLTPELAATLNLAVATGVLVLGVTHGGRAWQSFMRPGDVVITVDGEEVSSSGEFKEALLHSTPNRGSLLRVISRGQLGFVCLDHGD
jgi:S1-C subfamily serine protease